MGDRLFFPSGLLGLGAVAMSLILTLIGPRATGPLPDGFITPVMAFEFAESAAEVTTLFEPEGSAAAMDRVNRWDFLFMTLYSLFLVTFALAAALDSGQFTLWFAAALAPLILLADVMENVQLLNLTAQLSIGGGMEPALARLHLFTWLKWGGLAVYFLLIGNYFRIQPGIWRFVWVLAGVPAIFALWAFLHRGPTHELMALSIGVLFLVLTLHALWRGLTRGLVARGA